MGALVRRLASIFCRRKLDADLEAELRSHVEMAVEANLRKGMTPEIARREALVNFGGVEQAKERCRDERGLPVLETAIEDIRFGLRMLRRKPGFAAVIVITLSLGVGATTAIFSVVNPILFEPLPYPHSGRIAAIVETGPDGSRGGGTFAMYRQFAEHARSLESIAVFRPWRPALAGADQPRRLEGSRVSAGYFHVLGVSPVVGRDFDADDDRPNGRRVVILSDAIWRLRFGGDRAIVGRGIRLDDSEYRVIGVMPRNFENVEASSAGIWAPLQYDPALPPNGREWGHHLVTLARLRPGVTIDGASRELERLGSSFLRERHPETYDPETRFRATSLREDLTRGVRPRLLAILGAAVVVLIIACQNVTNLLLARGLERRPEFALRASLGAGRRRLVRQLLTESLLLAAMGGAAGLAIAKLGLRALSALAPPELPRVGAIAINGSVFAFCFGLTAVIGLAFGLIPAFQVAGSDPQRALSQGGRRIFGGHRRIRGALVVAEVALALVLLVSSGLLLRSLARLFAVDAGFDASRMLTLQVQTNGHRFDDAGATHRFFDAALDAVARVPGVTSAAFTSQLALSGDRDEYGVAFEAGPSRPAATYGSFRYAVSPGYLATMRIPLRRGRLFDERDRAGAPLVALISQSLATERFRGHDPLGARVRIGPAGPFTIVGVVGNVRQMSLAMSESDAVYIPAGQWPMGDSVMSFVVRTHGDPAAMSSAVQSAIWSVDRDQPVTRVARLDDLVAASAAERRFALILFEAFGLAALALAAAGIYGVMSGSVAERTREIGVRSALGATRGNILAWVFRGGMRLTAIGAAIGLAGAAAAGRAISAMLFGISSLDPVTYLAVAALLAAVSAIACGVPAWRAARVDPATTLRAE